MSTFAIPRPDWVSDDLVADRGLNAGFQMYSEEGNDACAKLILDLVQKSEAEKWRRMDFLRWLKMGVAELATVHPEVHDTEPEWAITDAVNAYFDTVGWVKADRDEVFW